MKYQITAMDLHFLVKELNDELKDARADKVFEPNKQEFLIGFHAPGKGKRLLRIELPRFLYLTGFKESMPEKPREFALMLRKYISGARLRQIKQAGFERIIEMHFEKKEGSFLLILELFSAGNLILTDKDKVIRSVLEAKKWKTRTLRGNVRYEYPEIRTDPLNMGEEDFVSLVACSDKESLVKALAIDVGLGGAYAEELCCRAGIDKDKKRAEKDEARALYSSLMKLSKAKAEPNVVYDEGNVVAILPVRFKTMADKETEEFKTMSDAFDSVITNEKIDEEEKKKTAPYTKEQGRLLKQKEEQTAQIEKLKKDAGDNQEKGEAIYQNYALAETLLAQLKDIIKKHSQKEIKEKLKDHDKIKEINFKDKKVTIEF